MSKISYNRKRNPKNRMKIRIKTIIDVIVVISFSIIILISILALTFSHIENTQLKFIIQIKQVEIQALLVACEQDYLIKRIRGKEK